MLSTCSLLLERRIDKTRREMTASRDLILQAKSDLMAVFNKLRDIKKLTQRSS